MYLLYLGRKLPKVSIGLKITEVPWLNGSLGWSTIPCTTKLWVRLPVRAHAWVVGSIPGQGVYGGNQLMFLSLSPPSSLLKINKYTLR